MKIKKKNFGLILMIGTLMFFCLSCGNSTSEEKTEKVKNNNDIVYQKKAGMTFNEAELQGIKIQNLNSVYKSAVNADTSQAVFKSDIAQEALIQAWNKMLQDLGNFLRKNNFKWDKPTVCFNKIYFNSDGKIDYFLYNFINGKDEEQLSQIKQTEFNRLLNLFIKDYKFPLTAKTKFTQCGQARYMPYSIPMKS